MYEAALVDEVLSILRYMDIEDLACKFHGLAPQFLTSPKSGYLQPEKSYLMGNYGGVWRYPRA